MWAVDMCNEDGSRTLDRPELFSNEFVVFETLGRDFEKIEFVRETQRGIIYRLSDDSIPGSIYVEVYHVSV